MWVLEKGGGGAAGGGGGGSDGKKEEGGLGAERMFHLSVSSWFCVILFIVKHFELLKRSVLEMSHCFVLYCY